MDVWKRIENWLQKHCPKAYKDLDAPATERDIADAQNSFLAQLPADMLEIYSCHNGQMGIGPPIAAEWQFLSLEDSVRQWGIQKKLLEDGTFANSRATATGPVRADWWNLKWIPFAYNGSGDLQCVDLDPGEGGTPGQIVIYWHDRERRECVANSLLSWFESLADDFEAGRYAVEGNRILRQ
jgi:cell wall assembly regulator SMI1